MYSKFEEDIGSDYDNIVKECEKNGIEIPIDWRYYIKLGYFYKNVCELKNMKFCVNCFCSMYEYVEGYSKTKDLCEKCLNKKKVPNCEICKSNKHMNYYKSEEFAYSYQCNICNIKYIEDNGDSYSIFKTIIAAYLCEHHICNNIKSDKHNSKKEFIVCMDCVNKIQ